MINELFECISIKIKKLFPNALIYFNKPEQNFKTPAFFVKCLNVEEVKMISNREKISAYFEISYFHNDEEFITEGYNEVLQKFIDNFELLPFRESFLRTRNLAFSTEDNIFKLNLDYSFYINKNIEETEKMQKLFY